MRGLIQCALRRIKLPFFVDVAGCILLPLLLMICSMFLRCECFFYPCNGIVNCRQLISCLRVSPAYGEGRKFFLVLFHKFVILISRSEKMVRIQLFSCFTGRFIISSDLLLQISAAFFVIFWEFGHYVLGFYAQIIGHKNPNYWENAYSLSRISRRSNSSLIPINWANSLCLIYWRISGYLSNTKSYLSGLGNESSFAR